MNASKFSEFTFSEASAKGLQHNAMFAQVKMVGRISRHFTQPAPQHTAFPLARSFERVLPEQVG